MSLNKNKLLVVFPGIGYTCDKPLLYYTKKLAIAKGYEVVDVPYGNFEKGIFKDDEKIKNAIDYALKQTEDLLADANLSEYSDIMFCSKSIGTCVAAKYEENHNLNVRHIFYTPIEASFEYIHNSGLTFHGTSDPWCRNDYFEKEVSKLGAAYHLIENGNHSLETGDVDLDLKNLRDIIELVSSFL